jgi:hypothetical protein
VAPNRPVEKEVPSGPWIITESGLINTLSASKVEVSYRSARGPVHPSPFSGPPGGFSSRPVVDNLRVDAVLVGADLGWHWNQC